MGLASLAKRGEMLRLQRQAEKEFGKAVKVHVKNLDEIVRSFRRINKCASKKDKRKALGRAAKPLIAEARALAPVSKRPHKRKAGDRVVTYMPGNLRKSIKVLPLRKSNNRIFVGPKVARKKGADTYGVSASTVDAYYAHWVEFGNSMYTGRPYMRPALDRSKGKVYATLRKELAAMLEECEKKNKVR